MIYITWQWSTGMLWAASNIFKHSNAQNVVFVMWMNEFRNKVITWIARLTAVFLWYGFSKHRRRLLFNEKQPNVESYSTVHSPFELWTFSIIAKMKTLWFLHRGDKHTHTHIPLAWFHVNVLCMCVVSNTYTPEQTNTCFIDWRGTCSPVKTWHWKQNIARPSYSAQCK